MTSRFESGSESRHTAAADVDNPFRVELMATRPKTEPKTDAPSVVNNTENNHFNNPSNSKADAAAAAKASADATARANATGGNASARSGDATATAGSSSAKTGDVTVNNNAPRGITAYSEGDLIPAATNGSGAKASFGWSVGEGSKAIKFNLNSDSGFESDAFGLNLHVPLWDGVLGLGVTSSSSRLGPQENTNRVGDAGLATGLSLLGKVTGDDEATQIGNAAYKRIMTPAPEGGSK